MQGITMEARILEEADHLYNSIQQQDGKPFVLEILANLWAVHNNSNDWDEPEKFIPERHLDKDGKFVKLNNVIPFSIGSRNCLGEALGRAEVFLFVVKIMKKFKVLPNPDNPTPPEDGIPGVVYTPQHYPLIMKEK